MIELKPCPFCGGEAILKQDVRYPRSGKYEGKSVKAYEVICSNYDCIIYGADNKYFFTKEEATEAWNKRTPGWISVNKRLPEREEAVVVLTEGMELLVAKIDEKFDYWYHEEGAFSMSYVTHWFPIPELPEPPTLEGDEQND